MATTVEPPGGGARLAPHARGEVFKALMREALLRDPGLDVSDLPWRRRAIAAARRLADAGSHEDLAARSAEVDLLLSGRPGGASRLLDEVDEATRRLRDGTGTAGDLLAARRALVERFDALARERDEALLRVAEAEARVTTPPNVHPPTYGRVRAMDEIDAARPTTAWLDEMIMRAPRVGNEQVTYESADCWMKVWWVACRPRAVAVVFRDQVNFAHAIGIDCGEVDRDLDDPPEGGGDVTWIDPTG